MRDVHPAPALVQTFPTALGVVDFSRRLAARPCEIFSKPWHQSGHFPPTPRVVGFSLRKVATVWVFHQALAPSWAFFAHCFGKLTFPRASQTTCGIFPTDVWYPGTSEKFALTTSGGNDGLSPALWKSPQRCVSVMRWVCAVLGPARHSLAMVHKLPGNFCPSAAVGCSDVVEGEGKEEVETAVRVVDEVKVPVREVDEEVAC